MDINKFRTPNSPGDGITMPMLSSEPLATEGEATPGDDEFNPFQEYEVKQEMELADKREADAEAELVEMGMPDFVPEKDGSSWPTLPEF